MILQLIRNRDVLSCTEKSAVSMFQALTSIFVMVLIQTSLVLFHKTKLIENVKFPLNLKY